MPKFSGLTRLDKIRNLLSHNEGRIQRRRDYRDGALQDASFIAGYPSRQEELNFFRKQAMDYHLSNLEAMRLRDNLRDMKREEEYRRKLQSLGYEDEAPSITGSNWAEELRKQNPQY